MKKLLLVALAAVGMAACVQNEELVAHKGDAIKFNNAFVENPTKVAQDGSYSNQNMFNAFKVWGTMENGAAPIQIFNGVDVSNATGAWDYDAQYTQYWINGYTYNFAAVVGATVDATNGLPAVINVDMEEQKDVLYATASRTYNGDSSAVGLTFKHLLAKAKFTVSNTMTVESGFGYQVSDITIEGAEKEAAYDVVNGWTSTSTYNVSFGPATNDNVNAANLQAGQTEESNYVRYLVPEANKTLNIKVTYTLNLNGTQLGDVKTEEVVAALDVEAGRAYNFIITFGNPGDKITFEPTVEGWLEGADLPIYEGGVALVSSPAALQEAIESDEVATVILSGDINLAELLSRAADPSLKVKAGKELTLDLNGKKLSATSTQTGKNYDMIDVRGNLTVKNGAIEYKHEGENMGWGASTNIFNVTAGGVLNLEGVTAKNLGGSDMGFVAHLNNWGEVTLNAENCTLESNYVAVRVFNSGYDMNNVTIKNSTLKGVSAAFWVHNYTVADFGTEAKAESQKALLNFNIYNQDNTFSPDVNGIRYGFTNSIRTDAYGITKVLSEDGSEVTLGYFLDDNNGLVRRGVVGAEENTTIKKVVVGEGIATLYDRTFRRFYALEEVVLPSTLTTIGAAGSGVFQSCNNLKTVVLPANLTVLGKGSFQECSSLESINIPAGVTRIEADALRNTGLKEVEFHEGVTYFGAQAFRDCKQLTKVVINAPEFTMEGNTFGIMAAPYTPMTIEVANEEMKAYVESKLTAHAKTYITVVAPAVINNTADLQAALAEGKNVALANNLTISANEMTTAPYGNKMAFSQKGGVFNGNGKAISVTTGGDNYVLMTNGGTIKNLDIDRGFRGVVLMYPTQDVYVDNVKVGVNDEVCYTINTAEGDGTHSLYVSNSALNGWCSIGTAVKDVTFTNCTFGQGTYYTNVYGRLVKPYVDAVFDGCDFCSMCYLDLSAFVGTKVIVKNCSVNGVKITAENWASLVAPEATCGEGQISVELKNGSYLTAENVADYIVFE